jgi:hypothetical protein
MYIRNSQYGESSQQPLVDRVFWGLLILSLVYVVGFFYYQATIPNRLLLKHRTITYTVAEKCEILIEYPTRVPIEAPDKPGLPINVWFYFTDDITTTYANTPTYCSSAISNTSPITYSIGFGPIGEGVEFTNREGTLVPAVLFAFPSHSETTAEPLTLYIRRSSTAKLNNVKLKLQVLYIADEQTFPLKVEPSITDATISPELPTTSRLRHLWEALFQSNGPVQWLMTVLVGFLGLLRFYHEWQQSQQERLSREQERKDREEKRYHDQLANIERQIKEASSLESRFQRYIHLKDEYRYVSKTKDSSNSTSRVSRVLYRYFDTRWLPCMKKDLVRCLNSEDMHVTDDRLTILEREWKLCIGEEKYKQLQEYCVLIKSQSRLSQLTRQDWDKVIAGFQLLGLTATDCTVNWINNYYSSDHESREIIISSLESQAAARYLIQHSNFSSEEGLAVLDKPVKSRLWLATNDSSDLALSRPFGAEKAEFDSMLPQFFIETPAWNEIKACYPSLFIAPPGSGRTALIWKLREEPERKFPVYTQVSRYTSVADLTFDIQHALTKAWYEAIAYDPYALLGLQTAQQRNIMTLLLHEAGSKTGLFKELEDTGFDEDNPERGLLEDVLQSVTNSINKTTLLWDLSRLHPYQCNCTLLLLDINIEGYQQIDQIVRLVMDQWLPVFGPRAIIPKVFIDAVPTYCPIGPKELKWSRENLLRLLERRCTNLPDLLHNCVEGKEQPIEALIQAAQGKPKLLLTLSNALWDKKDRFPLNREEFQEILEYVA